MRSWFFKKENGFALLERTSTDACYAEYDQLIGELDRIINAITNDSAIKLLIITGATVDGDINRGFASTLPQNQNFLTYLNQVLNKLEHLEKPKVAAVNGKAFDLFLEIILACDWRLASRGSLIGQQYIKLSVMPEGQGFMRLTRLIGTGRANSMVLTGEILDAGKALEYGLINQVVPEEDLISEARKKAAEIIFQAGKNRNGLDKSYTGSIISQPASAKLSKEKVVFLNGSHKTR